MTVCHSFEDLFILTKQNWMFFSGWYYYGNNNFGAYYKRFNQTLTWQAAQNTCSETCSYGGDLAIPYSIEGKPQKLKYFISVKMNFINNPSLIE